jgi:hypothetical protein
MITSELKASLRLQLSELDQTLMLVAYESNSSRISHEKGVMQFRGFSGVVRVSAEDGMTIQDKEVVLFSSKRPEDGVDQALIDRLKRINKELMDIYEQQVLSGD